MDSPYRELGYLETNEQKVARLRREYDMIAISAQTTPEANARALARMREIAGILDSMRRWT